MVTNLGGAVKMSVSNAVVIYFKLVYTINVREFELGGEASIWKYKKRLSEHELGKCKQAQLWELLLSKLKFIIVASGSHELFLSCTTDIQLGRLQTSYTIPCNGVISRRAQISSLRDFADQTYTPLTNHSYFAYRQKPEDPQFEPHTRIHMAQVLGPPLYISALHIQIWAYALNIHSPPRPPHSSSTPPPPGRFTASLLFYKGY